MPLPLDKRFLSNEDAQRLYEKYPDLRPDPDEYCPTCGKRGVYKWQGVEHVCDCAQQLQFYKHYLNAGIGVLYQRLSWDDFEGDKALRGLVMDTYLKNHERMVSGGVSLILTGEFGVGKTFAMNLLLKDLLHLGYTCYATTFAGMIEMFTAGWSSKEDKAFFQRRVTMSQVLLLDDLGREYKSNNKLSETTFDFLLRTRVQNGRPTFITTNMTTAQLREGYGSAVISLLSENAILQEVSGSDFRKKAQHRTMAEITSGSVRPIV